MARQELASVKIRLTSAHDVLSHLIWKISNMFALFFYVKYEVCEVEIINQNVAEGGY